MIYKFKSQATGDLIMMGPHGDHLLELLGRTPAAKGIIDVADLPAAIQTLEHAVNADERKAEAGRDTPAATESDGADRQPVGLRQRLWPMVEMLRRAQAAGDPVVWGV